MNLVIITSNNIYRDVLLKALSGLDVNICTYLDISEVVGTDAIDLALCCISHDNMDDAIEFSGLVECFGILDKDLSFNDDAQINFVSLFKAPVRLGSLVKSIDLYLKKIQQKHLLKPIKMGDFRLDPRTSNLECDDGSLIRLTEKEQNILIYLHSFQGVSVSRQDLLNHVWGYVQGIETHTLETHIYRLRQKIEIDPAVPKFLITDDDGYYLKL